MAKKKPVKPQREMTKHQLSRWEQQKRRQRTIFLSGIIVIVVALVMVGVGWYIGDYRPLHETVIKVNDVDFDMNYFINMLKIVGKGQDASYMYYLAYQVPQIIERNELIKEGAATLGITVNDDEIEAELTKQELSDDYWDIVRTQLLENKLLADYFDEQVPTSAEQRQVMAMLLESESQASEIRARLENGEDFVTLAKEFSLAANAKDNGGDFGWHPKGVLTSLLGTSVPDDYAFGSEKGVLSQPRYDENLYKTLGYWLVKVVSDDTNTDASKVHVWAMLLSSAEQAQDIKARLENGEDFATLAKEFSQEYNAETDGGDFGLVTKDNLYKAVADYAFDSATELGKLSDPIRDDSITTKGGYWLIKVVDVEADRQLSDDDRSTLKNAALNQWVASLFADSANKIDDSFLTVDKIDFAINRATGG